MKLCSPQKCPSLALPEILKQLTLIKLDDFGDFIAIKRSWPFYSYVYKYVYGSFCDFLDQPLLSNTFLKKTVFRRKM